MVPGRIKIIRESQIDLKALAGLRIAIIGYGSQGRAQALNLRDSGFTSIIGLPARSRSRLTARNDGFMVATPAKAVQGSDVISILVPDHKHKELFDIELNDVIKKGQTFVFAHGLSVHFKLVSQPKGVNFVLVAPHGPGLRLREKFIADRGVSAFIGKTEASTRKSLKLALAYAKAIGCSRSGLIATTFSEEAIGDIFGEQAVLCGGLSALLKAGYDTLAKAGLSPDKAYLECVYQLDLIVDLIKKYGIGGMYERISTTAAYGSLFAEDKIINAASRKAMESILNKVKSGRFTTELMADYHNSFKDLKKLKKKKRSLMLDKMARYFDRNFDP